MNTILRAERENKQQFFDTYKIILSRVSREIAHSIASSEPGCFVEIPAHVPQRPEYDHHEMAIAIHRSIRRCKGFHVQLRQLENIRFVVVSWSNDIIERKKQHIFEDILRKARLKVSEYVKSKEYKSTQHKCIHFVVPARIPGYEGYDVYTASLYVGEKLQTDGFEVSTFVNKDLLPVLSISWKHVS